MHTRRFRLTLMTGLLLLAAVIVVACSGQPGGNLVDPTATIPPTEAPSATPGRDQPGFEPTPGAVLTGTAQIETIELLILESFPVQIHAKVTGYLGDGCTTLGEITQVREGDTFKVTIATSRPADAICTQQLVGFEETLPLDVAGLPRIDPNTVTAALFQAVRPGGVVAVIDHVAAPERETRAEVEATHRIDPAVIRADFERAGFVFEAESDLLRNPADDRAVNVFQPSIRGRTGRVVYRFRRPR